MTSYFVAGVRGQEARTAICTGGKNAMYGQRETTLSNTQTLQAKSGEFPKGAAKHES